MITKDLIRASFPNLKESFGDKYIRKYELQQILDISKGEADLIIDILFENKVIENSSLGWRWKKDASL